MPLHYNSTTKTNPRIQWWIIIICARLVGESTTIMPLPCHAIPIKPFIFGSFACSPNLCRNWNTYNYINTIASKSDVSVKRAEKKLTGRVWKIRRSRRRNEIKMKSNRNYNRDEKSINQQLTNEIKSKEGKPDEGKGNSSKSTQNIL